MTHEYHTYGCSFYRVFWVYPCRQHTHPLAGRWSQWGLFIRTGVELARMIHDGSSRNRGATSRDQRAEQMGTANKKGDSLHQYMEGPKDEPTGRRLVAAANPQLQQKRS